MLAKKENFVELDPEVKDKWGIPVLKIHFTHSDNDYKLMEDFQYRAEELFKKAGGEIMQGMGRGGPAGSPDTKSADQPVGSKPAAKRDTLNGAIHETVTARMSHDPKDGVLNSYCQTHDIANLYVFGGNAFCSTGDKHPTLTMLALSARGCTHLLEQTKS
jgi:choline dehydrogenase-like flavoprotein